MAKKLSNVSLNVTIKSCNKENVVSLINLNVFGLWGHPT